jgi:hypothetical protein
LKLFPNMRSILCEREGVKLSDCGGNTALGSVDPPLRSSGISGQATAQALP